MGIFRTVRFPLIHLPTMFLLIGYPVYWLELYVFRYGAGKTSPLAWFLFTSVAAVLGIRCRPEGAWRAIRSFWREQRQFERILLVGCFVFGVAVVLAGLSAATLPPHLIQESDALVYHYSLPHQHLIRHSFAFLPWASADLFLMPVQFALSPFWFATALPNKFPQFIFFLGIVALGGKLSYRFAGKARAAVWGAIAVLSLHGLGIQLGTAMLDVVVAYLFLAALDSWLEGNEKLAALEFAFFFWAKPFLPFQVGAIVLMLGIGLFLIRSLPGWSVHRAFENADGYQWPRRMKTEGKNFVLMFILLSSFIAGPFLIKSGCCSGTLFYPFGINEAAIANDVPARAMLIEAARAHWQSKEDYGGGRSLSNLLSHFWLAAVPEKGVNNRFDYPLGLTYLLFLGPFVYLSARSIRQKQFIVLPFGVWFYWVSWWLGSQQSRFLYVPVLLIIILTIPAMGRPRFLSAALTIALILNFFSVWRAHKADFGRTGWEALRTEDRKVAALNGKLAVDREPVSLQGNFVTYARFPVEVTTKQLPFIMGVKGYDETQHFDAGL